MRSLLHKHSHKRRGNSALLSALRQPFPTMPTQILTHSRTSNGKSVKPALSLLVQHERMAFKPPNASELAGVQRMKDRLAAAQPPVTHKFGDTALLRFYRGRKAIDEDVYKALVRHANWRKENDVDNIANEIYRFQKEMNAGKFVVEGYDLTGRPAIFIHARKHNKNDRDLEELRLLIIYTMETILKRTKPDEERMLICFDLTDFRLSCMDYDMVKLLISILEFNYPETLSSALIINAPFMFYACWAVIRPWLDPVTAAKVAFVNGDKLAEHITFTAPVAQASRVNVPGSSKLGSPITPSAASDQGSSKANSSKALAEVHADFEAAFNQELNPNSPTLTISSQKSKKITGKKWWAWS